MTSSDSSRGRGEVPTTLIRMDSVWRYLQGLFILTEPIEIKAQDELLLNLFDAKPYDDRFNNPRLRELRMLLMLHGFSSTGYELASKGDIPMRGGVLTARHRMLAHTQLRQWLLSLGKDPREFLQDAITGE